LHLVEGEFPHNVRGGDGDDLGRNCGDAAGGL
jgi:hypothetical protein